MDTLLSIPWVLMWLLAVLVYAAAKMATLAGANRQDISLGRKVSYLLLFTGMNATEFCGKARNNSHSNEMRHWIVNAIAGAALLWGAARLIPTPLLLLRGWTGMVGIVHAYVRLDWLRAVMSGCCKTRTNRGGASRRHGRGTASHRLVGTRIRTRGSED